MPSLQDFGVRFRLFREALGVSQAALARELGVAPATLSNVEGGKNHLGPEYLAALSDQHDLDVSWLLTGKGTMFSSGARVVEAAEGYHAPNQARLNVELLQRIIEDIERYLDAEDREMDPDKKASLIGIMYEFLEHGEGRGTDDTGLLGRMIKLAG